MDNEESPYISYAKEHSITFMSIGALLVLIIIIIIIVLSIGPSKSTFTDGTSYMVDQSKWNFNKSGKKPGLSDQ